jgi:DNA polymerase-1
MDGIAPLFKAKWISCSFCVGNTGDFMLILRWIILSPSSPTPIRLIPLILEYRHSVKLAGIARTLRKFYNPLTESVHSELIQSGVPTGRFRCQNPNLQQIPEVLRSVFIPRAGHYFIGLDFDQAELRVLAACAGETELVEAFQRGEDPHCKTASKMLGVPLSEVTPEQRSIGKMLGYSQLYGSGPSGLSHKLHIPKKQAIALLEQYFAALPRLVAFLETLRQRALSQGYVESYYGRRRPLPELYSSNPKVQAFGLRSAVNGFAQSTVADLTKQAMVRLDKALKRFNAFMLVQLHDGLLLEVPDPVPLKEVLPELREAMETEILGLPLTLSASWGHNWHDLKKV